VSYLYHKRIVVQKQCMIIIIDVGLLVLIWMVQLLIYPSFLYFEAKDLLRWHPLYTRHMTVIVLPLMVAELLTHMWLLYTHFSYIQLLLCIMVVSIWAVTFLVSVPLHGKISKEENLKDTCKSLVNTNWIRTVLWSLVVLVQLLIGISD